MSRRPFLFSLLVSAGVGLTQFQGCSVSPPGGVCYDLWPVAPQYPIFGEYLSVRHPLGGPLHRRDETDCAHSGLFGGKRFLDGFQEKPLGFL